MYAQGIFNLFALLPTATAPHRVPGSKEPDEKKTQSLEPEKLKFQVQLRVLLVLRYDQDSLLDLTFNRFLQVLYAPTFRIHLVGLVLPIVAKVLLSHSAAPPSCIHDPILHPYHLHMICKQAVLPLARIPLGQFNQNHPTPVVSDVSS